MTIQHNISLKNFNTFGVDCIASRFVEIDDKAALATLPALITEHPRYMVLGGGSNVLFTSDYPGLVIKMGMKGRFVRNDGGDIFITVGAGENWHEFVKFTIDNGYYGLENLALIPGSVGAAPVQNIGAYGVEQERFCLAVNGFDLEKGRSRMLQGGECRFAYRDSIFKNELKGRFIITSVTYRLSAQGDPDLSYKELKENIESHGLEKTPESIFSAVCEIRRNKLPDPSVQGNAGSFFKNPLISRSQLEWLLQLDGTARFFETGSGDVYKVSAAWLIDSCGLKGLAVNDAAVSDRHALILINRGHATGEDVFRLSEKVIDAVHQKYGITLEREVNVIR